MTTWKALRARTVVTMTVLALAGCSSSDGGVTTGSLSSLLPGSKPKQADPVTDRALQVAATSARASKCGYNFDPAKLKAQYIAYETGQGAPADRVGKIYDTALASVAGKIGPPDEYCTDERTATIKADLTRHLAGDYAPSKRSQEGGAFDWLASKSESRPWRKEETFCPGGSCY